MHQSLLDPKILRLVITSEIGKSSLSAVARTCKTFSEIALDVLWGELHSVVPLLLLFGTLYEHKTPVSTPLPIKKVIGRSSSSSEWRFVNSYISAGQWNRSFRYRNRVLKLSATTHHRGDTLLKLSECIFSSIMFAAPPNQTFLPSLVSLTLFLSDSKGAHFRFLLSQQLEHLTITLNLGPSDAGACLLEDVPVKAPKLRYLYLCAPPLGANSNNMEKEIEACMAGLGTLGEISVPPSWLTSRILRTASQSTTISKVWSNMSASSLGCMQQVVDAKGTSFANATKLTISIESAEHLSFLAMQDFKTLLLLQHLNLNVPVHSLDAQKELASFLSQLVTARPSIISLDLNLNGMATAIVPALSLNNLHILFALPDLRKLIVRHPAPLEMTTSDLRQMLEAWPQLEELSLCASPRYQAIGLCSGLPIEALRVVACHAPNIRHLGLYFNDCHSPTDEDPIEFKNLTVLDVGSSRIENRENIIPTAFLLARLRTPPLQIIGVWNTPLTAPNPLQITGGFSLESPPTGWREIVTVSAGMIKMRGESGKEGSEREMTRENLVSKLEDEINLRKQMEEKLRVMEQRLATIQNEDWVV